MKIIEHNNFYACNGRRFEFEPGNFRSKLEARELADDYRLSLLKTKNKDQR